MTPFRWSIGKREQLGRLLDKQQLPDILNTDYFTMLRTATARIIVMSNGANLGFIGRTPENFYDYLSGVFSEVADVPTVTLVPFSLRGYGDNGRIEAVKPHQLSGLFSCFEDLGVDAASVAATGQGLALVDYISSGMTLENFVGLLHLQSKAQGVDWNAVQRKLRIVGLREQRHNSPNTWRWQQHQDWLDLIPDTIIKNVSVPGQFIWPLANDQPKVTQSFVPQRWSENEVEGAGEISPDQILALALAVRLYDIGNSRDERLALAREISEQPNAMTDPPIRRLVSRLKGL